MKNRSFSLVSACLAYLCLIIPAGAQPTTGVGVAVRDYVLSILEDHPALGQARAELDATRAMARSQTQPLYNPEIEFEYEDAASETKGVGVTQTLDLSGKRSARSGLAAADTTTAEARFDILRKALLAEILTTLSNYQKAAEALQVSQQRVRLDQEFLAIAQRRRESGDLPQSELLTARLALAEAQAAASAASIDFSRAEQSLQALAGPLQAVPPPLVGIPAKALPSLAAVAMAELPEIRLAAANTVAAQSGIRVAKRNRIPDPTVGLRFGEEREVSPLGSMESATLFGVRLSIPIPVRNTFSAEVDAAHAGLIAAEQGYQEIHRKVEARLAATLRRYQTASEAWQSWAGQGADPLESQRVLLQRLWDAGEISAVDYIIQLNQTFATETAGIELKGRLWATWFEWLDASAFIDEWMENIQ
ncbi:MAG: TolC family protein [Sphingomonadales bacterium]|nr:TolC family protein [Sphingomonadales bacterium]